MDTRKADLEQLRREYKTESDPGLRKQMRETGEKIRKESGEIKSMRKRLLKEHRKGNMENVKDIHDIVSKNRKYQNA